MKWIPFLILFVCSTAQASVVVCFDQNNRVSFFNRSANTPDFDQNPNCLINPTLPATSNKEHWKRVGLINKRIVELSQAEKDVLAQAKQQRIDDVNNLRLSTRTKLSGLGFTNEEIRLILSRL